MSPPPSPPSAAAVARRLLIPLVLKLIGEDFPARGQAYRNLSVADLDDLTSLAFERHRALNWLCGLAPANDRDQTPSAT